MDSYSPLNSLISKLLCRNTADLTFYNLLHFDISNDISSPTFSLSCVNCLCEKLEPQNHSASVSVVSTDNSVQTRL
jgi:hypothetical protein